MTGKHQGLAEWNPNSVSGAQGGLGPGRNPTPRPSGSCRHSQSRAGGRVAKALTISPPPSDCSTGVPIGCDQPKARGQRSLLSTQRAEAGGQ